MAGTIETSCANGIFRIVINDPERLNAMTPALADTVHAQLLRAQAEARVVVLGGAGKAFCAGANLADVMSDPDTLADGGSVLEHHYNPLVRTIRDLKIALITSVRGEAVGIGASLALDRQRGGSGKSVSVRVDLGGRRIIKTKLQAIENKICRLRDKS